MKYFEFCVIILTKGQMFMPDRQSYSTRARKYISDFLEDRGENTASAADIIKSEGHFG